MCILSINIIESQICTPVMWVMGLQCFRGRGPKTEDKPVNKCINHVISGRVTFSGERRVRGMDKLW